MTSEEIQKLREPQYHANFNLMMYEDGAVSVTWTANAINEKTKLLNDTLSEHLVEKLKKMVLDMQEKESSNELKN